MTVHGMAPNSVSARAETLADIAGMQLVKPHINGRQLHRVSQAVSDETDSDYFKRSIWQPYLDKVIVEMKDRFGKMSVMAFLLTFCSNVLQRTHGKFHEISYFLW